MNRLDLELKLKELDPSGFQRLCDYLLNKQGYKIIPFGNSEGRSVVRKGTPDSYILNENDKTMIFVEYTIQSTDLGNKIISDVNKCLEKATGFNEYVLNEIYYFTNSNNVDPAIIDSATTLCNSHNVKFKLFTQFEICELVYRYKSVIRDYFNETLDDDLLLSLDDFIDYTKALKGVDHSFEFVERIEDEKRINESINSNLFSIITGEPGVGKSMLVIQALKKYYDQIVCIRKANENSLDYVFEASKNCEY